MEKSNKNCFDNIINKPLPKIENEIKNNIDK